MRLRCQGGRESVARACGRKMFSASKSAADNARRKHGNAHLPTLFERVHTGDKAILLAVFRERRVRRHASKLPQGGQAILRRQAARVPINERST